ncbi:MAG: aspartate dehydrogenase [Betaproteobacteria bacterium]|nr:aspartate dehydrogenase [Betaproteobacteria bacterium]
MMNKPGVGGGPLQFPAVEPLTIGIIGFGAIGSAVAHAISCGDAGHTRLAAVLCRHPDTHGDAWRHLNDSSAAILTANFSEFLRAAPDLVIEAAGQDALRKYARGVLQAGADLLATSIGAFTDEIFLASLAACAASAGGRLLLASGALPGVEWMQSAALAGSCSASITQSKPVASWRGTPASDFVDLDRLAGPACFFEGTARAAAQRFPKSSNITAMLALVTAGLDATNVRLVADPVSTGMRTLIDFASPAGRVRIEWHGVPSALNPSTSADVPLNIVRTLRNLTSAVAFGP